MGEEQLVVFRLGNEEYGVSISQVREIIQYRTATRLPNTPDFMEGIISLRSKVIPALDLAKKFGLSMNVENDRHAIIVDIAGREVGVIVTEVTEVLLLSGEQIEDAPLLAGSNECIRGVGKTANRLLIILDLSQLLSVDELEAIVVA